MPVKKLPIQTFIDTKSSFMRKKDKSNNVQAQQRYQTQKEEQEQLAAGMGLMLIDEFDFSHCVQKINREKLQHDPFTQLSEVYRRCAEFLRLSGRPDVGVTCIITADWFFLGVLTHPYTTTNEGYPVYLDGLSFAGLISLQTNEDSWPATAGLADETISITQALKKSTDMTKVAEAETAMDFQ